MLSAVSGGEVIQDVPACFAGNILDDNYGIPTQSSRPIPDVGYAPHEGSLCTTSLARRR